MEYAGMRGSDFTAGGESRRCARPGALCSATATSGTASRGRHCRSTLPLAGIDCHSLGIYTVVLVPLLSVSATMTVSSRATRHGACDNNSAGTRRTLHMGFACSKCARRVVGPGVGPASALYGCITTGLRGPSCIFWAGLTLPHRRQASDRYIISLAPADFTVE